MKKKSMLALGLTVLTVLIAAAAWAADEPPTAESNLTAIELVQSHADYVWTLVAAALVFFMQAGFAMVEVGFTRAKNAINILMKNLMDFSVGSDCLLGHRIRFDVRCQPSTGWFGTTRILFKRFPALTAIPGLLAFWMFQVVFCATAATIVSGAMAERTKFSSYIIYSVVVSAPSSTPFSAVGPGAACSTAAAGWKAWALSISPVPRSSTPWAAGPDWPGPSSWGRAWANTPRTARLEPFPGHNLPLGALGVFILWLGWFGFNPGSTTAANKEIAWIFVNTNLAAAAGATLAMFTSWIKFGKPEISMSLNGALAGLVAITAPCYNVTPLSAVIIGAIAGVLVVMSVLFFDKIKVDDPVGAVSVHGVCGAWGTLAAGIFNVEGFSLSVIGVQVIGIVACFIWAFGLGFIMFKIIDKTVGLRVSAEEETDGLDFHEHGGNAYPDFQVSAYAQK